MIFAAFLAMTIASPPSGTYGYVSKMNGAEIGRTAITVSQSANGLMLSENGSGSMNGQSGSVQDTLSVDASLQPVSYSAVASIADSRNMRSAITFSPTLASQTGDVAKVYRLSGAAKHFVLMDVGPFSGFFMLPAQLQAWGVSPVTAIVPNFAFSQVLSPEALTGVPRPSGIPASDSAYELNGMVALTIWYDPKTLVVDEVDVPAQGLIVKKI